MRFVPQRTSLGHWLIRDVHEGEYFHLHGEIVECTEEEARELADLLEKIARPHHEDCYCQLEEAEALAKLEDRPC